MGFLPDRSQVVVRHILERRAAELPGKECLLFENGESWNYQEALQEAYRAANALFRMGVRRGERVLIFLPNGRDWIRTWWGATSLGAVIVPVNTAYKGEVLRHICEDSQSHHLITTPDLAERLREINLEAEFAVIDPASLAQGPGDEPKLDRPIEPWDIHEIIYTSGTTGTSKGVLLPYLHLHRSTQVWWSQATGHDTMLVDHPLFHISGMYSVYFPLIVGGRMALRTIFSGSRYLEVIRATGATMAIMIGTITNFLNQTIPEPDDADNPLRMVACQLMVPNPQAFMIRFGLKRFISMFGMSETGPVTINHNPAENPMSCGQARPGLQLRLVDDHDIPVPAGEVGELIIRTDLPWELNAGYWRRPEETARAWRNGWFHTGDMFSRDDQGNYYFRDRKKDAIRRRGENISSFEVEREVLTYPAVSEAACVSAPGEYGEEEVKVFVVPRQGQPFDPGDLIRFLIPKMPYFMIPRYIEVIPELPKTATLRVKKYELRQQGNTPATWDREAAGIIIKRQD